MQLTLGKNASIGRKLNWGFGSVIILMLISTVLSYLSLSKMNNSQTQVTEVRYPAVLAGRDLVNGVNQSLAALRGYMILGGDASAATQFKDERGKAWKDIQQAITRLNGLVNQLSTDNIELIKQVKDELNELAKNQQAIEDIAQTPENQPALKLLTHQAGPRANQMLELLGQIIDEEQEQGADEERKELFKFLSDSRGPFAISVGSLRAYLITGDSKFKDQFDENWLINTDAYVEIDENIELLTEEQLAAWQQYEQLREEFAPLSIDMFELRVSTKWNIANHMLAADVEPKVRKITQWLEQIRQSEQANVQQDLSNLENSLIGVYEVLIGATIIAAIVGSVVGKTISRSIVRSMSLLVNQARDITDGNLVTRSSSDKMLKSNDEIGKLANNFESMTEALNSMILDIKEHSTQMDISTFQVSTLSEEILSISAEEAERSNEVDDATQQLLSASNSNQQLAMAALDVVQTSQQQAQSGINAVEATIAAMEQSVDEVKQTSEEIQELEEASQEINQITQTIHQIADQTNLLALNAAIEAARAGEYGRGFSVVADEVRNLAIKTTTATEEISTVINKLLAKMEQSVQSMGRAADHVYSSQQSAAQTGEAINSLSDSIAQISTSNEQISEGAQMQLVQINLLQEKLGHLFSALKDDACRAESVSILTTILGEVTVTVNELLARFTTTPRLKSQLVIHEKRSSYRYKGYLRAQITQDGETVQGATRDISAEGLGLKSRAQLRKDTPILITVFLPNKDQDREPLSIEGQIMHQETRRGFNVYGVQVIKQDEHTAQKLQQAIAIFED